MPVLACPILRHSCDSPPAAWSAEGSRSLLHLLRALFPSGTQPASSPASQEASGPAEAAWGKAAAGLQAALGVEGPLAPGGALKVRVALRSIGSVPVKLPPANEVFGWLELAYSREEAWISEKVFVVPAADLADWPAELAGGKAIQFPVLDLGGRGAYPYAQRREVYTAFLAGAGEALPRAEATLAKKLAPGSARAQFVLCIPRPGESPLAVRSAAVAVEIGQPQWSALPPGERKAALAKLLARFDRDAWSAKAAHDEAVAIGPAILPELIEAARQTSRPGHSRLWLTTAVCDIRDDRAAAALTAMLDDGDAGVRHVVAYHGVKQLSPPLDQAIIAHVAGGSDTRATALAVLGFLCFRRTVPDKLLSISFESPDPRVRSLFASALKDHAGDYNVSRLVSLLSDKEPRVRSAAAKALGAFGRPSEPVIAALVAALDRPDDAARAAVAEALGSLTGRSMPYDPKADAETKAKTIQAWKDWWTNRTKDDRKRE